MKPFQNNMPGPYAQRKENFSSDQKTQSGETGSASPQPHSPEGSCDDQPFAARENPSSGGQNNSGNEWINNPALGGINPAKLQMLSSLASQAKGKNQSELLPFLMAAAAQSQSKQLSFNNDEIDAVISVMKIGKSPQEIQQIDRLCGLIRQFRQLNH